MLVLTRKHQEKIRIGDHITITVLKTKGKTVRLGIEAPAEIPVLRGELSFEGKPVEWQVEVSDGEPAPARPQRGEQLQIDRVRSHWPTESQTGDAPQQISLQRVSREQLGKMLPKAIAGPAPLRALVERRSVSA
jgi:carbon storage regulator CsrA